MELKGEKLESCPIISVLLFMRDKLISFLGFLVSIIL